MLKLATRSDTIHIGTDRLRIGPVTGTGIPGGATAASAPPGRRRVFTGDWLMGGCGCHIYNEGYYGELVRRWNGWAVFRVTRAVAEAIVAQQQHTFHHIMIEAMGRGAEASDAWLATLGSMPATSWLLGMIVVDSRVGFGDPTMVEVTMPDTEGCYTIGWGWHWDDVDAADVHSIYGGDGQ